MKYFIDMALQVRQYQSSDQNTVYNLHFPALKYIYAPIFGGEWEDDLRNIEKHYLANNGEYLVGILKGKIIAMGGLRKIYHESAELRRMRAHPDFRRRGFGQITFSLLEKRAKVIGYKSLELDTISSQVAAISFYRKHGFTEINRGVEEGIKTIFMEKVL